MPNCLQAFELAQGREVANRPSKRASVRSALPSFARSEFALMRSARTRRHERRSALSRYASWRSAPLRFAPPKSAGEVRLPSGCCALHWFQSSSPSSGLRDVQGSPWPRDLACFQLASAMLQPTLKRAPEGRQFSRGSSQLGKPLRIVERVTNAVIETPMYENASPALRDGIA